VALTPSVEGREVRRVGLAGCGRVTGHYLTREDEMIAYKIVKRGKQWALYVNAWVVGVFDSRVEAEYYVRGKGK
jgi:hypothetical protein